MAKATGSDEAAALDAQEQIRQLRAQLDALMAEKVAPAMQSAMESAADQLGDAAESARGFAAEELEGLARQVRARPLTALLAAAAVGFVIARLTR